MNLVLLKPAKPKAAPKTVSEIIAGSACFVRIYKLSSDASLSSVWIEFKGLAARIPSSGNGKTPGITKRGRLYIRHNGKHYTKLDAMTKLFGHSLIQQGTPLPSFGERPVQVIGLCSDRPGRWDSHNQCKPIGDWLQTVGVIDDDSRAIIKCYKKSDFRPESFLESRFAPLRYVFDDRLSTTIVIQERSAIQSLIEQTTYEYLQASTGLFRLIG